MNSPACALSNHHEPGPAKVDPKQTLRTRRKFSLYDPCESRRKTRCLSKLGLPPGDLGHFRIEVLKY